MATRGRQPGFHMSDEHRTKIANSQILKRLIDAAEGNVEMTPTQATIGLGLLRKVMPDLSANQTDLSGNVQIETIERRIVDPGNTDR